MDKKMGSGKAIDIDPRLKQIINGAKFVQNCDLNRWKPVIMRARQDGIIKQSFQLARNLN